MFGSLFSGVADLTGALVGTTLGVVATVAEPLLEVTESVGDVAGEILHDTADVVRDCNPNN